MSEDNQTPPPLRVMKGEGDDVAKLDLLVEYVRGIWIQQHKLLERFDASDRRADDHSRDIEELQRKLRGKKGPEPHWLWRAAAIGIVTTFATIVVQFVLKGGLSLGVGP